MYRVGKEEAEAVSRVILSGSYFKVNNIYGETEKAENEMKELFGVKNALLMTSGMAALVSGLTALGIGPGDQVIVPAYTYIATAMAVVAVGAIPVIAECDETLTVDPDDAERKITGATKAVIPVHIQGFPCNMDAICAMAKKHGIKVVEDACQADGAKYKGRRLGSIGDFGALSFNQYKLISTGEGGALLTNDEGLYQRALIYHDSNAVVFFGDQMKNVTEKAFCGTEYRTNEIQTAMLRVQLGRMDPMIDDLRRIKKRIMEELKDKYRFIPSNDSDGDLSTTLAFAFGSAAEAEKFAAATGGYSCVTPDSSRIGFSNGKIRYALLPVWMLNIKYMGTNYKFAINGQTGKVVGTYPTDKKKKWRYFGKVAAIGYVIAALIAFWLLH